VDSAAGVGWAVAAGVASPAVEDFEAVGFVEDSLGAEDLTAGLAAIASSSETAFSATALSSELGSFPGRTVAFTIRSFGIIPRTLIHPDTDIHITAVT